MIGNRLHRAIRVYYALVESALPADSSTPFSWDKTRSVLKGSKNNGQALINELGKLHESELSATLGLVGSFFPFIPDGETFIFESNAQAVEFGKRADSTSDAAVVMLSPNIVNVFGRDTNFGPLAESFRGKPYVPSALEEFESIDPEMLYGLLEALTPEGLPPGEEHADMACKFALAALKPHFSASLSESISDLDPHSWREHMGRLGHVETLVKPKKIHGQETLLVEGMKKLGLVDRDGKPVVKSLDEAAPKDRGVSTDSPNDTANPTSKSDGRGGVVAGPEDMPSKSSKSEDDPNKEAKMPQEGDVNDPNKLDTDMVTLPDGTEIPEKTLRLAFASMLDTLAKEFASSANQDEKIEPSQEPAPVEPEEPADKDPEMAQDKEAPKDADGAPVSESKMSMQDYVSHKIEILRKEGKPQDQAAAIAYSMAKDKGYEVPEPKNESRKITVRESSKHIRCIFNKDLLESKETTVVEMGHGIKSILTKSDKPALIELQFPKPAFELTEALDWIKNRGWGKPPESRTPALSEAAKTVEAPAAVATDPREALLESAVRKCMADPLFMGIVEGVRFHETFHDTSLLLSNELSSSDIHEVINRLHERADQLRAKSLVSLTEDELVELERLGLGSDEDSGVYRAGLKGLGLLGASEFKVLSEAVTSSPVDKIKSVRSKIEKLAAPVLVSVS